MARFLPQFDVAPVECERKEVEGADINVENCCELRNNDQPRHVVFCTFECHIAHRACYVKLLALHQRESGKGGKLPKHDASMSSAPLLIQPNSAVQPSDLI